MGHAVCVAASTAHRIITVGQAGRWLRLSRQELAAYFWDGGSANSPPLTYDGLLYINGGRGIVVCHSSGASGDIS